MVWREGYGKFFPKGTRSRSRCTTTSSEPRRPIRPKIGFKFATKPVHTQVNTTIVLNNTLVVPPMVQKHEVIGAFQFPTDARIHGLRPHMHLRAQLGTASLITPGRRAPRAAAHPATGTTPGRTTTCWRARRASRAGRSLEYLASYDNSPANPLNPDPKASVPWGQQVWDEMHSTYMTWTAVNEHNKDDDEPIQITPNKLFTGNATASR